MEKADFVLSLALQKHSLVVVVDVYYYRHPHISGLFMNGKGDQQNQ
jgi:hypothetical protein